MIDETNNEAVNSVSGNENVEDSNYYIEAIKEMKQNSVSRSEYQKLQEENRNLLKSLVNGETIDQPVAKEPVDIDKLRDDLFNTEGQTNLDFIKKALQLREAVYEKDGTDIFLPYGHQVNITNDDIEAANRVADAFQHCVDYADGDPEVFTNELMRITKDTYIPSMAQMRNRFR